MVGTKLILRPGTKRTLLVLITRRQIHQVLVHQTLARQTLARQTLAPQNLARQTLARQTLVLHLPVTKRPVVPPAAAKQTPQHLKLTPLGV